MRAPWLPFWRGNESRLFEHHEETADGRLGQEAQVKPEAGRIRPTSTGGQARRNARTLCARRLQGTPEPARWEHLSTAEP